MATHQFDHLSLVVSDAELSLQGLTRSIQVGSVDMQQGALYARNLSGALSVLGLDTAASLVEDVARQLTLNPRIPLANSSDMHHARPSALRGDGLIDALATQTLKVMGRSQGLARLRQMRQAVEIVDVDRPEAKNRH